MGLLYHHSSTRQVRMPSVRRRPACHAPAWSWRNRQGLTGTSIDVDGSFVIYLIDDYSSLSVVPVEVKSGKDYTIHSALNTFVQNEDYNIKKAYVVSNERTVQQNGKVIYIPIYYVMFLDANAAIEETLF